MAPQALTEPAKPLPYPVLPCTATDQSCRRAILARWTYANYPPS